MMQPQTPTYSEAQSEGSVNFRSARRPLRGVDYSKYKTRMCRNFLNGANCPFGTRCAFSHGEPEGRDEEPPPYAALEEEMLPPAYPARFRHDPYSFSGVLFEE